MRWLVSWFLFCAGHITEKMVQDWQPDWLAYRLVAAYQRLMAWSSTVQGSGSGPWEYVE